MKRIREEGFDHGIRGKDGRGVEENTEKSFLTQISRMVTDEADQRRGV
jgi:hypothetical protein